MHSVFSPPFSLKDELKKLLIMNLLIKEMMILIFTATNNLFNFFPNF